MVRSFRKYLHGHAAGFGAAAVLFLDKVSSLDPSDGLGAFSLQDWCSIAAAYLGVGGLIATLPHGGVGAVAREPEEAPHDDGTEDESEDDEAEIAGP